jgi:hypothetical protein
MPGSPEVVLVEGHECMELAEGESVSCQRVVRTGAMTGDWGSWACSWSREVLGIERGVFK